MACPYCDGPTGETGCDCWKGRLSPSTRAARQMMILALYFTKLDQKAFEVKQERGSLAEKVVRGGFGNSKAEKAG